MYILHPSLHLKMYGFEMTSQWSRVIAIAQKRDQIAQITLTLDHCVPNLNGWTICTLDKGKCGTQMIAEILCPIMSISDHASIRNAIKFLA